MLNKNPWSIFPLGDGTYQVVKRNDYTTPGLYWLSHPEHQDNYQLDAAVRIIRLLNGKQQ